MNFCFESGGPFDRPKVCPYDEKVGYQRWTLRLAG